MAYDESEMRTRQKRIWHPENPSVLNNITNVPEQKKTYAGDKNLNR